MINTGINIRLTPAVTERVLLRRPQLSGIDALVYLRVMRELAVQNGVPFDPIDDSNPRLALPEPLIPVSEKLINYALGKTSAYGLTANEEALIYRRYVHISSHWNPVNDWYSGVEPVFINRPGDSDLRTVHPND